MFLTDVCKGWVTCGGQARPGQDKKYTPSNSLSQAGPKINETHQTELMEC